MNTKPSHLPSLPGVYLFKHNNEIIYVGKAKNIKKRVNSYFQKTDDWKVNALIFEHTHIEHIITHSEHDALLLEAQLIGDRKPKFNVLLKTGQPFLYIAFSSGKHPQMELVRNKGEKKTYFGPFLQKRIARNVYEYLMTTFRLRLCKTRVENGCLNFHIGKCAGNCMPNFDDEQYNFRLYLAKELLRGNYKETLTALTKRIKEHTEKLEFEKAKNLYEYEQHLEYIFETLKHKFSEKKYEKDVFLATTPIHKKNSEDKEIGFELQKKFNLPNAPHTIDCFDISHFQSSYIVGSCIRFKHGVPDKNNFRRFAIKTLVEQNDYAALQEIAARRYRNPEEMPDLVLIDGGKGQLNAVQPLFPDLPMISLAKREERVFGKSINPEGIPLDVKNKVGKLLISLRDYAHHFAISYHRKKRHMKI